MRAMPITFRIPGITGSFLLGVIADESIINRSCQGEKNETHAESPEDADNRSSDGRSEPGVELYYHLGEFHAHPEQSARHAIEKKYHRINQPEREPEFQGVNLQGESPDDRRPDGGRRSLLYRRGGRFAKKSV